MSKEHNYYSTLEISGKVHRISPEEEMANSARLWIRLLYRDENSPAKFVNVYIFDKSLKQQIVDLHLGKDDTILVSGELGFDENKKEPQLSKYFLGARSIRLLAKSDAEEPQKRMAY